VGVPAKDLCPHPEDRWNGGQIVMGGGVNSQWLQAQDLNLLG
jgi:hypothetical protein